MDIQQALKGTWLLESRTFLDGTIYKLPDVYFALIITSNVISAHLVSPNNPGENPVYIGFVGKYEISESNDLIVYPKVFTYKTPSDEASVEVSDENAKPNITPIEVIGNKIRFNWLSNIPTMTFEGNIYTDSWGYRLIRQETELS